MTTRPTRLALALLAALVAAPATAATGQAWAGYELDNEDGQRLDLGVAVTTAGGTTLSLDGSRSEVEGTGFAFTSTAAHAGLERRVGRGALGIGLRQSDDDGIGDSQGLVLDGRVDAGDWRLGAAVELRATDFDRSPFTVTGADLGLTGIASATGSAACSVDGRGLTLRASFAPAGWQLRAAATGWDYSGFECRGELTSVTTTGGTSGTPRTFTLRRLAAFPRLAARVTSAVSGYSASRIPRESALLESSAMLGVGVDVGRDAQLGFEAWRDAEQFVDSSTTTLLATLSLALGESWTLTLTGGVADSDTLDRVGFGGAQLAVAF